MGSRGQVVGQAEISRVFGLSKCVITDQTAVSQRVVVQFTKEQRKTLFCSLTLSSLFDR